MKNFRKLFVFIMPSLFVVSFFCIYVLLDRIRNDGDINVMVAIFQSMLITIMETTLILVFSIFVLKIKI